MFAAAQITLFVKLMLTVLVLDAQSRDTFTLPKSVAAHATSLVLAALLVWLLARYGRRLLVWSPVHVAAGALLAAFALATVFALDPTIALFGTPKRFLGLTQMLDNVVLYLGAVLLMRDGRSLRLLTMVTVGTAVPVALYAALQKAELDPLIFKEEVHPLVATLGNPDLTGSYLAMAGITAFGIAFLMAQRISRLALGAMVLVGLLSTAMLLLTGVRAGALALGAGFVATVLLAVLLPWRKTWWLKGAVALGVLLIVGVLVSPIASRFRIDKLANDPSIVGRVIIWNTAEEAVASRPILGLGPDNFAVYYPAHRSPGNAATSVLENSTHSFWLYVGTSAGIVGVLALFAFIALVVEQAIRGARRGNVAALALVPFLAYLGQSFVGINELVLDWVFWLSAGLIAASAAAAVGPSRTGYARPRRASAVGIAAIAVAVLAIFTLVLPRIGAEEAMTKADQLSAVDRGPEAVAVAEEAVRSDPRRGESWSVYGTALTTSGHLPAAIAAYTAASEREPWLPLGWRNLAIVWAQLGNRGAARASAERALLADPNDGESHDLVSALAYDAGDYVRAAAEAERAIALRLPPLEGTYVNAVSAYIQLKDLPRAEALAREGIALYPRPTRLRLQLAAILADEGKTAEALVLVNGVLADTPNDPAALALKKALTAK